MENEKQRVVQEYVPGKQVTFAHLIANRRSEVCQKLGLSEDQTGAIGILTITPSEGAIIAGDVATKASDVRIGFLDRFSGSLVLVGDVGSVEEALQSVLNMLTNVMKFTPTVITRS